MHESGEGDGSRERASASESPIELNRAHWDRLATIHGQDRYYDAEGLVAGRVGLGRYEAAAVAAAVGEVLDLQVLHLQCHLGFDAIALAREGARVTGLDFSSESLRRAAALAERCGVSIDWVQADATDPPPALHARFDLVYATLGVLSWIADIGAWMRSAATVLQPGGRVALVEVHPLFTMVAESGEPLRLDFPYAFEGPRRFEHSGSYADPDSRAEVGATIEYAHSLGETVTAAIGAGLRIDALHEHLDADVDPRGDILTRGPDGHLRLQMSGERLPILFTLLATRAV
jgi:SAM-dependent methyltransferase